MEGKESVPLLGRFSITEDGEPVCAVDINLTPEAQDDPLLAGLPASFRGFVGHKKGTDLEQTTQQNEAKVAAALTDKKADLARAIVEKVVEAYGH